MQRFGSNGYQATSVETLVRCTGIGQVHEHLPAEIPRPEQRTPGLMGTTCAEISPALWPRRSWVPQQVEASRSARGRPDVPRAALAFEARMSTVPPPVTSASTSAHRNAASLLLQHVLHAWLEDFLEPEKQSEHPGSGFLQLLRRITDHR